MNELSQSTLKIYNSNLNSISKAISVARDNNEQWLKNNSKKIIDYIKTKKSIHTQKNLYSAIIAMGKRAKISNQDLKKYEDEMYNSAVEIEEIYGSNIMNEKQKENWITSAELEKIIIDLKKEVEAINNIDSYSKYKKLMVYLIILIHSKIPLRNDLSLAKIYHSNDFLKDKNKITNDFNYIVIGSNPRIILNVYKTAKDYGEKIIPLDKMINDELLKYYDEITAFSNNHFFLVQKEDDNHLSKSQFISWFQSAFPNKKVGSTMLRTIAVSELYNVAPNQFKKEQQLAEIMGHSVSTAKSKYAKILPK